MTDIVYGTPEQVADQMETFIERVGGDGFMLSAIHTPGAIEDFVDQVVQAFGKEAAVYMGGPDKQDDKRPQIKAVSRDQGTSGPGKCTNEKPKTPTMTLRR